MQPHLAADIAVTTPAGRKFADELSDGLSVEALNAPVSQAGRGPAFTNSADVDLASGQSDLSTSVGKALALLNAFDSPAGVLGVTALADAAGIPKSTAFRLLVALQVSGFVERRGTGYCVGRRMFELGNLVADCRPRSLRDVALPYLSDLYALTHQTVHLATLDGTDVLYLEKLFGHNKTRVPSHVGRRFPAHCTAIGKAILAHSDETTVNRVIQRGLRPRTPYTIVAPDLFRGVLERSRTSGVAYDREEGTIGVACVGAPILAGDRVVAAISVSGAPPTYDPMRFASAVRKAAEGISAKLNFRV